jgi:hypothetical protein
MSVKNLPEVSQETINTIFEQLTIMEVDLDENPLIYGPQRLNSKIAEARGYQTACEKLFLQVSLWHQKYRSGARALKLNLDLSKKHLFSNDPEVRAGRNLADRDAIASMKLKDEVEEVSEAESVLEDLESMIAVIRSKKSDLKDVQSRLKDQIRLCQEEISLGSRWGNKKFGQVEKEEPKKEGHTTIKQLHEMFKGEEPPEVTQEQSKQSQTLLQGTYEEGMGDFLDAISNTEVSETRKSEVDIESLLGDMNF